MYSLQCSEMVREIIDQVDEIKRYCLNEIKTWRRIKIKTVKVFSLKLADSFHDKFKDSSEATITKDDFYTHWGSITIDTGDRPPWYYPYLLIDLVLLGGNLDTLFSGLKRLDEFIKIGTFIDAAVGLERSLAVDFEPAEIDILKTIHSLRNKTKLGIIDYNGLGKHAGIESYMAEYYWKNLDKFFHPSIIIDHGKLELFPVLIKHERGLTSLEKQYTLYSFHVQDHYYSLTFIPRGSSWLEVNEKGKEAFDVLDHVDTMEQGWNLTHFTEKARGRWGVYPGLHRKDVSRIDRKGVSYNREQRAIKGFHARDFEILASLNRIISRTSLAAEELGIHPSTFSKRLSFLLDNDLFYPKINFHRCGLDTERFIVVHALKQDVQPLLERIKTSLAYFPHSVVYSGENALITKIKMPGRWLKEYYIDLANLTAPGGAWHGKIRAITAPTRTIATVKNKLSDLHELVVITTEEPGKPLDYTWTFEMPRYRNE